MSKTFSMYVYAHMDVRVHHHNQPIAFGVHFCQKAKATSVIFFSKIKINTDYNIMSFPIAAQTPIIMRCELWWLYNYIVETNCCMTPIVVCSLMGSSPYPKINILKVDTIWTLTKMGSRI